jgi:hypothetical protein
VTVNATNGGGLVSVAVSGVLQKAPNKKPAQKDEATLAREHSNQLTDQDKARMEKEKAQEKKDSRKENKSWIPNWMPEMSLSGNVSYSQINDITTAGIYQGVISSVHNVDVEALNNAWIVSYAGSASITKSYSDPGTNAGATSGNSTTPGNEKPPQNKPVISGAGSVSVTVNNIGGTTRAFIDGSTLSIAGDLNVAADTNQMIIGIATSGSIASTKNNSGIGIAGSGAVNMMTSLTEAYVKNSIISSSGAISITAFDNSIIGTMAGSMSVTVATSDKKTDTDSSNSKPRSQAAVSVSPSLALSIVNSTVHAYASDSTLIADNAIKVNAVSNEMVISLASGISGAGANANKSSFALAGAGSASINVINSEVEAYIAESDQGAGRKVQSLNETVTVSAEDNSLIVSNAGALGISNAKGNDWGVGIALGAAVAVNIVDKKAQAGISGANVESKKDVIVSSKSDSFIWALTMGGFGAGAKGTEKFAFALAAGAAGSVNMIDSVVESYISENSAITIDSTGTGAVKLSAEDNAAIDATSLVVGVSGAVGKTSAAAASLGGSFAVNVLNKEVRSYISSSEVTSAKQVEIDALSNGSI